MAYCEQILLFEGSSTFDEVSNNISRKSKQNAFNDLFHFKVPSKDENPEIGKMNTLLNYNFKIQTIDKPELAHISSKRVKQTSKILYGQKS